jgi:anti-anti-sigma factor
MEEYRHIAVSVLSGSAGYTLVVELLDRRVFEPPVVRELAAELQDVLSSKRARYVVIDLARLHYASSGALNLLIDLNDRIRGEGGRLVLCGLGRQVAEIFEITHLDQRLEIAATQSEALQRFT